MTLTSVGSSPPPPTWTGLSLDLVDEGDRAAAVDGDDRRGEVADGHGDGGSGRGGRRQHDRGRGDGEPAENRDGDTAPCRPVDATGCHLRSTSDSTYCWVTSVTLLNDDV
ncbi:hypothetical protein JKP76_05060 [Blastococcus sp. TML/C7B]|uniref:hypothetical protein n=1 Tax=Blastococcus sp. TML/C7B TaxID=2798728 RepID=UPI00190E2EFB|nr:hypothetical protein [Blastococcus sp. TML/C7B]MBN1095454.1 hypothetical protein [Blastococcus sp. TML/C7B]